MCCNHGLIAGTGMCVIYIPMILSLIRMSLIKNIKKHTPLTQVAFLTAFDRETSMTESYIVITFLHDGFVLYAFVVHQ